MDRLNQKKNGVGNNATSSSTVITTPVVTQVATPVSSQTISGSGSTQAPLPSSTPQKLSNISAVTDSGSITAPLKRPRIELTPEQRKRIERNRLKALEIQKQKQLNSRDGASASTETIGPIPLYNNVRLQKEPVDTNKSQQPLKPSIHKKDYIEYDFSTMKDSHGGFIGADDIVLGSGSSDATNKSLEEWKERQRQQEVIREPPPPLDITNAPKCFECGSIEIDHKFFDNFNKIRVCRSCSRANPDKYALLTKTECREDYLLTDPELRDTGLLPRIEKPNPHGFSRMQLFLRFQVEEYAWKKWGSPEKLDEEWEKRETVRLQRKEKKYADKLKEMRKKTRAEEYTRKLRNGELLGQRHVHDWSEPVIFGENYKRRCIDCGLETEELIM